MKTKRIVTLSVLKEFLKSLWKSGVKKTFYGTQAEWDALTDEQKNKYDMYILTDVANANNGAVITNQGEHFIEYKTNLILADNKPIYMTYVVFTRPAGNTSLIPFNINLGKVDKVISASSTGEITGGGGIYTDAYPNSRFNYIIYEQQLGRLYHDRNTKELFLTGTLGNSYDYISAEIIYTKED